MLDRAWALSIRFTKTIDIIDNAHALSSILSVQIENTWIHVFTLVVEAHEEAEDLRHVAGLPGDREGEVQGDRRGAHHRDRNPQSKAGGNAGRLCPLGDRWFDR